MEKDKKDKNSNHCDAEAQKKMTEKLTECDNENTDGKKRSECYEGVTKEKSDNDDNACINS